jgi:hypothetical protein
MFRAVWPLFEVKSSRKQDVKAAKVRPLRLAGDEVSQFEHI